MQYIVPGRHIRAINRGQRLTGATATPVRRSNLDRVSGGSDRHDGDAETKDEAADNELGEDVGSRDDDHAHDNDGSASKHSLSSSVAIRQHGGEWGANHGTTAASGCESANDEG